MILLFTGALICHAALAASRPPARNLTSFYIWIALGGALGGIFAAVLAPRLFTSIFEYPLLLAAAMFFRRPAENSLPRRLAQGAALAALILAVGSILPALRLQKGRTVHVSRNFFGVKRVVEVDGPVRQLYHGDTMHGLERLDPEGSGLPLAYYHPEGPMGDVMSMMDDRAAQRIGVVGLGAGSIAAYARPGRHVTFFEIDPDIEAIAAEYFTFLRRCGSSCDVIAGDGRLSIARFPSHTFDLLVLDAFSSDAVPPHLLSKEALDIYRSKLKPDGAVLFHVSNRYLNVKDLVAALVTDAQLPAFVRVDGVAASPPSPFRAATQYVIAAATPNGAHALGSIATNPRWQSVARPSGVEVWTDDYSNLIALLR
jgi:SAM-dependent methyltransferase